MARPIHRWILRLALSAAQVYSWIFLFQFFYMRSGANIAEALSSLVLTFALMHVIVVLLTPIAARRLRSGFKRLIFTGVLALASAFAVLCASFAGYLGPIGWGIGIFAVLMGVYRAFYWIPYEFSRTVAPGSAGPLWEASIAFVPAIVGVSLALDAYAALALLAAASLIAMLSLIPLFNMRDSQERFIWSYRQTFHELFTIGHRRMLFESIASGMEMMVLILLWPLTIFLLLDWSYPLLGIVLSLTYIAALSLRRILKKPLQFASTPLRAILASSAWILRLTVAGAAGIVLVDTYFYTGSRVSTRGTDMMTSEHGADNNTYIDEFTALKEMGMAIGRILMSLAVVGLLLLVSVPITFIFVFLMAAIAAAVSVLLSTRS